MSTQRQQRRMWFIAVLLVCLHTSGLPQTIFAPTIRDLVPDENWGCLFIIGGGNDDECLPKFVKMVKEGGHALVVLPHASGIPEEVGASVKKLFEEQYGLKDVQVLLPGDNRSIPAKAAIWVSGGKQKRLLAEVRKRSNGAGPRLQDQILQAQQMGCPIGGTSAGAAAVADQAIVDWLNPENPELSPGLRLLPGVVVDMHMNRIDTLLRWPNVQLKRIDRLHKAVEQLGMVGIGLPESTAICVRYKKNKEGLLQREAQVFGKSEVVVLRPMRTEGGKIEIKEEKIKPGQTFILPPQ